jgi:hypothetical protein
MVHGSEFVERGAGAGQPPLDMLTVSWWKGLGMLAVVVFETPLTNGAGDPVSPPDASDHEGLESEYEPTTWFDESSM